MKIPENILDAIESVRNIWYIIGHEECSSGGVIATPERERAKEHMAALVSALSAPAPIFAKSAPEDLKELERLCASERPGEIHVFENAIHTTALPVIHTKIYCAEEGTAHYRKFVSIGGKVIGELSSCEYNNFSVSALNLEPNGDNNGR